MSTSIVIKELKRIREEVVDALATIESKQKHKEVPVSEASADTAKKATISREKVRDLIELLRQDGILASIK